MIEVKHEAIEVRHEAIEVRHREIGKEVAGTGQRVGEGVGAEGIVGMTHDLWTDSDDAGRKQVNQRNRRYEHYCFSVGRNQVLVRGGVSEIF